MGEEEPFGLKYNACSASRGKLRFGRINQAVIRGRAILNVEFLILNDRKCVGSVRAKDFSPLPHDNNMPGSTRCDPTRIKNSKLT